MEVVKKNYSIDRGRPTPDQVSIHSEDQNTEHYIIP